MEFVVYIWVQALTGYWELVFSVIDGIAKILLIDQFLAGDPLWESLRKFIAAAVIIAVFVAGFVLVTLPLLVWNFHNQLGWVIAQYRRFAAWRHGAYALLDESIVRHSAQPEPEPDPELEDDIFSPFPDCGWEDDDARF